MEFDEMQKIWDDQRNETLFVINEEAMHNRVKVKKKQANKIVNVTEIGLMIVNSTTAVMLLIDAIRDKEGIYSYAGVVIMLFTVGYLIYIRRKRKKSDQRFDRTILGELDHAISNTTSTIKIGRTMIYWYFIPIAIFIVTKMIYQEASLEKWLLIIGAFLLGSYVANWEIKKCHIPRKRHLESLREKLVE